MRRSDVFIVNFEQILYIVLLFSLLTFNKDVSAETSTWVKPLSGVLQQSISGALLIKMLRYDLLLIFPKIDIMKYLDGKTWDDTAGDSNYQELQVLQNGSKHDVTETVFNKFSFM